MKRRVFGFLAIGLVGVALVGVRWSVDVSAKSKEKMNFFDKALREIVKGVENVERGARVVIRKIGAALSWPFKKSIKTFHAPISRNPFAFMKAEVRREGGPLSYGEKEFLKLRRPLARKVLEKFLGKKFPKNVSLPDVMVSLSGGGNRAAIYSWGFMRALEKIGLLDAVTHVATLSGSTWFLWPWLVSGLTVQEYEEKLLSAVTHGPSLRSARDIVHAANFVLRELAYGRTLSIIDFYGIGLGSILFHGMGENNDPLQVYMSSLYGALGYASIPYPILTTMSVPDIRWFAVTPHEFGCASLNAYIPVWSFDRRFFDGKSVGKKPYPARVSLADYLSMSSAAIAVSADDVFFNLFSSMKEGPVKKTLRAILKESPLSKLRLIYSDRNNFLYGMKDLPSYDAARSKTWGEIANIKYTDPGVRWGNPIPVLLERTRPDVPTILLIADASAGIGAPRLHDAQEFAEGDNPLNKKFPFPKVAAAGGFADRAMSVLSTDDILVLYFPRIIDRELIEKNKKNPDFKDLIKKQDYNMDQRLKKQYSTFNLKYTRKGAQELAAVSLFNVLANEKEIKGAMGDFIEKYIKRESREEKKKSKIPPASYSVPTGHGYKLDVKRPASSKRERKGKKTNQAEVKKRDASSER